MSKSLTDDAPIDFSTAHTCRECKRCGDYRRKELRAKVLEEAAKVADGLLSSPGKVKYGEPIPFEYFTDVGDEIRKLKANDKGE